MGQFLFANNAITTLAGSIGSGATTLTVAAGAGAKFPNPTAGDHFRATLINLITLAEEIVDCTARSGDVLTVARGQEGTTAVAWNSGDTIAMLCTAGTQAAFLQTAAIPAPGVGGAVKNLKITNSGGSPNSVMNITADELVLEAPGSPSPTFKATAVAVAPDITASGVNGLDTGAVAASTWYAQYIIYNGVTVAGLYSLSGTAPTMPAGYTFKAFVGWARTNGSSNFFKTLQYGRKVRYIGTPLPIMASGNGTVGDPAIPTFVAVPWANFAPPTASGLAMFATVQGTNSVVVIAPDNTYGNDVSSTNAIPYVTFADTNTRPGYVVDLMIESANVYWASTGTNFAMFCYGWEDNAVAA